jgi:hypothetical protein
MLALAFWSRYEVIPVIAAICIVIFLYILEHKISDVPTLHLFESGIIAFSVPSIYSIFLWVFFNWTIMEIPGIGGLVNIPILPILQYLNPK